MQIPSIKQSLRQRTQWIKTTSSFAADLWTLLHPYWKSEERASAWVLLLANILLTLGTVYMNVLFNRWYNLFYDSLQNKATAEFYHQLWRFCVLAFIYIVIAVYQIYLNQMLQIRWRRWLTDNYLTSWLADRNYYLMQLNQSSTDNPDQRISEDLRMLVDNSLSLGLGFLNATVTLGSFVGILWALSGSIQLSVGSITYTVYGYMVWVAVGYAIIGTWLTHRIGKPLIGFNFYQQRCEADFRFGLVRFRENTEGIALYRGEQGELKALRKRLGAVVDNWWAIMKRQKLLTWFTASYSQAAVVFPFVVAAPRYFSGAIQLGGLVQISNAFGQVQGALSWFIGAYTDFAAWMATVDRLISFRNSMLLAQDKNLNATEPIIVVDHGGPELVLEGLSLRVPPDRVLASEVSARIEAGDQVLIQGPSGSGKSTLFRAIAGIWPFGAGKIELPREFGALFLPQRAYFPIGTLRQAAAYPADSSAFTDEEIRDALAATGLGRFASRLDEEQAWEQQLSGGEQQLVGITRALLQRPGWLFMDEATSALDETNQARVYRLLREKLPHTTIVSIGHHSALAKFHCKFFKWPCEMSTVEQPLLSDGS
jgi:vitamin B12/bleomycin/antimicrobial peptide transport system ATP-binding/permease protein